MKRRIPIGTVYKVPAFSVNILVFVFAIFIVLIAMFLSFDKYREEIKFVASMLAGLAAIYSAYHVAEALKRNVEFNLKSKSFEFSQKVDQKEFVEAMTILDNFKAELFARGITVSQGNTYNKTFHSMINENKDTTSKSARLILNVFEDISVAVQEGFIDEEIIFLCIKTLYVRYVSDLEPYILHERIFRDNKSSLYQESIKSRNAWKENKFLTTDKSFHL